MYKKNYKKRVCHLAETCSIPKKPFQCWVSLPQVASQLVADLFSTEGFGEMHLAPLLSIKSHRTLIRYNRYFHPRATSMRVSSMLTYSQQICNITGGVSTS
ncbi:hypothetical protein FKM82_005746 [Ascaphus truei]